MNSIKIAILNALMAQLAGPVWAMAKELVGLFEATDLSGPERRAKIAESLTRHAGNLGLTVSTSLINLAIEAAVQRVRAEKRA